MFEIYALLVVILFSTFLLVQHNRKDPDRIYGIYAQPGKWYYFKYAIFLILLTLRRLKLKFSPSIPIEELETIRSLSEHPKAFDATFFHAVSKDDDVYICGGIERRHQGKVNGVFYLVVPDLGLLEHVRLPNTVMDADPESILLQNKYAAEGISFSMVEPMKKWKLSFNGPMKLAKQQKLVNVQLDGYWMSDLPHFFFETDTSLRALARAIAQELWSKQFFNNLKEAHQSHYEQMGYYNATLKIDGKEYGDLKMDAFRDHSFGGKRDWSLMHRYAFHMFYLDDGTRISVGVVSQPCTTSHLEMGYIILPNNKCLYTIESSDLYLPYHGENGRPGSDYAFSFKANNQIYECKIIVRYESEHFKGDNIEARLIERFVDCEINGIKGRGISEWQYNNLTKRTKI